MVFEQIRIRLIEKRPYFAFAIGFFYVLLGYATALIFFSSIISVAMMFLITLLLVPTVIKLFNVEEKRESRDALRHFMSDHRDIFEIYVFLFLGVFVGFFLVGLFSSVNVFDYQLNFLRSQQGLSSELVKNKLSTGIQPTFDGFLSIVENNLIVVLISFVLSFFYGAGSMFLIVLNASIFSTFILFVINNLGSATNKAAMFGIFLIHLIPELSGFLLAAVAGGILSKALVREKLGSDGFSNVMKDAMTIFLISVALIVIGALLETYVTTSLFNMFG